MLKRMDDNDFLEMKAVDIKFERLYYDGKIKKSRQSFSLLIMNVICMMHAHGVIYFGIQCS